MNRERQCVRADNEVNNAYVQDSEQRSKSHLSLQKEEWSVDIHDTFLVVRLSQVNETKQ